MFQVFTLKQTAELLNVAPRTVGKWLSSGRLKGYRATVNNDWRVPAMYINEFLVSHGMPIPSALKKSGLVIEINLEALETGTTDEVSNVLAELAKAIAGGSWQYAPSGVFYKQRCVGQVYHNQLLQDRTLLNAPAFPRELQEKGS